LNDFALERKMPRVLLPTDIFYLAESLVEGYRELGWEAVTGIRNFQIHASLYDVVHFSWPEEFSEWRPPNRLQLNRITEHLERWKRQAKIISSVHNLYPHCYKSNAEFHELYSIFYEHSDVLAHFSEASRRLVQDLYPAARRPRHVVHSPESFGLTLSRQVARGSRRREMGLSEDEFVVLVLGQLRSTAELTLIRQAFDCARVPKKRLLMAGTLNLVETRWRRRAIVLGWNSWLWTRRAVVSKKYVPEEEMFRLADSCDVVIVPRIESLTSAIPSFAMAFGRAVIAPDHGAYPEYLAGSRNLLYPSGDFQGLAAQIERASGLDLKDIGRENAAIAARWSWAKICELCVEELGYKAPIVNRRVC
jgi:glycosyltransferase involved in cell wall biosynthesis